MRFAHNLSLVLLSAVANATLITEVQPIELAVPGIVSVLILVGYAQV